MYVCMHACMYVCMVELGGSIEKAMLRKVQGSRGLLQLLFLIFTPNKSARVLTRPIYISG